MLCPSASWADAYSDAERSAKDFISYLEAFRKLDIEEVKGMVTAICDAEEADRKEIAQKAGRDAKAKVVDEVDKARKRMEEALTMLDGVLKDPTLADKHGAAEELKNQVNKTWESIDRMSSSVRGANHPVVAYMIDKGVELHQTRQRGCEVSEFDTGNGFADCIRTSCDIIEFKPDNSRSKSKGQEQLQRYQRGLQDQSVRDRLNSKNSDFAKCTQFRLTIEAYTLCPVIDDQGEFRDTSATWSTYTY